MHRPERIAQPRLGACNTPSPTSRALGHSGVEDQAHSTPLLTGSAQGKIIAARPEIAPEAFVEQHRNSSPSANSSATERSGAGSAVGGIPERRLSEGVEIIAQADEWLALLGMGEIDAVR